MTLHNVCMCVCVLFNPLLLAEVATPHVNACKSLLLLSCLHHHRTPSPPVVPPPPAPPPLETMPVNNQWGGQWTPLMQLKC